MHTLKIVKGRYFGDGKEFKSFREALEYVWKK